MIIDQITNPFNKWTHLVLVQRYNSENTALPRNDYFQYFEKLKVLPQRLAQIRSSFMQWCYWL